MAQSKRSYSGWSILVVSVVGLLAALGIFLYYRAKKKKSQEMEAELIDEEETVETPDESNLLNFYLIARKVISDHYGSDDPLKAQLLTAQAAFETGEFTSNVFKSNINAFGMRQAKVRETTSLGDRGGYASYPTVDESIKDRLLWDDYNKVNYEGATVKSFVQAIHKLGYFEAPFLQYQNGVNAYFKKLQSQISQG